MNCVVSTTTSQFCQTFILMTCLQEDKTTVNGSKPPQELIDAVEANGDLPLEQQQTLARIYQFLVQDGNSRGGQGANITLERLLQTYQVRTFCNGDFC